jgi:hypothetical protein
MSLKMIDVGADEVRVLDREISLPNPFTLAYRYCIKLVEGCRVRMYREVGFCCCCCCCWCMAVLDTHIFALV